MEYPISELMDRYSILHLKVKRLPENKDILEEYEKFGAAIKRHGADKSPYIDKMIAINGKIWDLEFKIRMSDDLILEEVGRRALLIRELNKERIALKNEIAKTHGGFQEVKVDHGSAENR